LLTLLHLLPASVAARKGISFAFRAGRRHEKAGHDPALVVRNAANRHLAPAPGANPGTEAEMDALTEIQPASQIEDEDVYDLIVDCQSFIAEIMERRLPKSVERQGSLLLGRLNASLDWQTVH
jgi:hypothetical protein